MQRLSFTTDAGCLVFLVQNGEKWEEGPCTECECQDAEVTCFQRSCPPCPLGSLAVEAKGDCCPHCKPGTDPRSIVSYRHLCWVGAWVSHTQRRLFRHPCDPCFLSTGPIPVFSFLLLINWFSYDFIRVLRDV